jgi:toxin ParE1/3/4
MKVRRLPPVDEEVIDAVAYYRAIEPNLGLRLVQELESVVQRIQRFPEGARQVAENLRRSPLRSFPYVVIYAVRDDDIVIIAFANTHRRPRYWRERLQDL